MRHLLVVRGRDVPGEHLHRRDAFFFFLLSHYDTDALATRLTLISPPLIKHAPSKCAFRVLGFTPPPSHISHFARQRLCSASRHLPPLSLCCVRKPVGHLAAGLFTSGEVRAGQRGGSAGRAPRGAERNQRR